jgi:hypothetical protein
MLFDMFSKFFAQQLLGAAAKGSLLVVRRLVELEPGGTELVEYSDGVLNLFRY